MHFQATACREASRLTRSTPAPAVWITDDVLANAFQRFLRVSQSTRKRYGSNVPGPLEANRRLARRRMMGLASMPVATSAEGGAVLFNWPWKRQELRWEAPYPTEPLLINRPSLETLLPPPPVLWENVLSEPPDADYDRLSAYTAQLDSVTCMQDLQELGARFGQSQLSEYRYAAIDTLLKKKASASTLLAALDPALELGSLRLKKLHSIVARMEQGLSQRNLFEAILLVVSEALTMGSLKDARTATLLELLQPLADKYEPLVSGTPERKMTLNPARLKVYTTIWHAITGRHPRKMLPPDLALGLIAELSRFQWSTESAGLRLALYKHAWPLEDGTVEHERTGRFLASWTRRLATKHLSDNKKKNNNNNNNNNDMDEPLTEEIVIDTLSNLPPERQRGWLFSTTKELALGAGRLKGTEVDREALNLWLAILQESAILGDAKTFDAGDWQIHYHIIAQRVRPQHMSRHLSILSSPEIARMLLEIWTPHYLEGGLKPFPNDRTASANNAGLTEIRTVMHSMCNWQYEYGSTLPFAHFIISWRRCGLTYRRVMEDVFDLVHKVHGSGEVLNVMRELEKAEVQIHPQPIVEALRHISETNPHLAARIMKARRIWLAHVPHLVVDLIRGHAHSSTVFDLLRLRDPTNSVPLEQRKGHKLNSLHDVRVELIHVMAHTFAHDVHSTHRVAFRNVWLCFQYLRARHAPIHPTIAKSLVWAGVVRPLRNGEWVSTVKFTWILGWVRRLEGEHSAQQLDQLVFQWRNQLLHAPGQPHAPHLCHKYKSRAVTWHTVPKRRSGVKVKYSGKLLPCIRYYEGVKSVNASFKTLNTVHTGAVARNIGCKDWQSM